MLNVRAKRGRTEEHAWTAPAEGDQPPGDTSIAAETTQPQTQYQHARFSPSGSTLWASPAGEGLQDGDFLFRSDWFALDETECSRHFPWLDALEFHPDGLLAAAIEYRDFSDVLLRFCLVQQGLWAEYLQPLRRAMQAGVGEKIQQVSFNPQGNKLLVVSGAPPRSSSLVIDFPSLRANCSLSLKGWEEYIEEIFGPGRQGNIGSESVQFAPDGAGILVGLLSGRLADFALEGHQIRQFYELTDRPIAATQVRARDGLLAVADLRGALSIFQLPHPPVSLAPGNQLTRSFIHMTEGEGAFVSETDLDLDIVVPWHQPEEIFSLEVFPDWDAPPTLQEASQKTVLRQEASPNDSSNDPDEDRYFWEEHDEF